MKTTRTPFLQPVLILRSALDVIRRETFTCRGVETGGILVGWKVRSGTILVTRATGPGAMAVQEPGYFELHPAFREEVLRGIRSELDERYVGDWHTHLVGNGEPSARDLRAVRDILTDPFYCDELCQMLLCIAQFDYDDGFSMKAWLASKGTSVIRLVSWEDLPATIALDSSFVRNSAETFPGEREKRARSKSSSSEEDLNDDITDFESPPGLGRRAERAPLLLSWNRQSSRERFAFQTTEGRYACRLVRNGRRENAPGPRAPAPAQHGPKGTRDYSEGREIVHGA